MKGLLQFPLTKLPYVVIFCKISDVQKILLEVGIYYDHPKTYHFSNKRSSDVISNNPQFYGRPRLETRVIDHCLSCIGRLNYIEKLLEKDI